MTRFNFPSFSSNLTDERKAPSIFLPNRSRAGEETSWEKTEGRASCQRWAIL